MRFIVLGTVGLGGFFAAVLARWREDVWLVGIRHMAANSPRPGDS